MTLRELRALCRDYPELSALWTNLVAEALCVEIIGLPLALVAHDGGKLTQEQICKYHKQDAIFNEVAQRFAHTCAKYGIDPPKLTAAGVCNSYR